MKHKIFCPEAYTVFATAFLSHQNLHSQVVIKDYDPDKRLLNWTTDAPENDSLFIDINDNGVYDILLYVDDLYEQSHALFIEGNDCVTAIYGSLTAFGNYVALGVSTGNLFGASIEDENWRSEQLKLKQATNSSFSDSSGGFTCSYFSDFFHLNEQYYGLKLNFGGETHYGWLRLDSRSLLGYEDGDCASPYGSPITVFEAAYELTANAAIIADHEGLNFQELQRLWDISDTGNFSELGLYIYDIVDNMPDYDEMRIYVIPDSTEALDFSVAQALSLPAENYMVFHPAGLFYDTTVTLSSDLKDIDGNNFDAADHYLAYTMKIPTDDAPLSLSSPTPVMQPYDHACELFAFINDVSISGATHTAADITVNFSANLYGEDQLSAYRISLAHSCYDFNVDILEPDQYKIVPVTGVSTYTTTLETILRDIDGDPVGADAYTIRIWATPDDEQVSLPCTSDNCAVADITGISDYALGNGVSIIQFENQLQVNINNFLDAEYKCIISDISGRTILSEKLNAESNSIALSNYPEGIYFAAVYRNNYPATVTKISIF